MMQRAADLPAENVLHRQTVRWIISVSEPPPDEDLTCLIMFLFNHQ